MTNGSLDCHYRFMGGILALVGGYISALSIVREVNMIYRCRKDRLAYFVFELLTSGSCSLCGIDKL